ncbi:MAG: hypothetical protein ACLQQ4_10145 [Bacteroidia bacterium]
MSTGESFDEILRSKFNIEHPVDEDNWKNARKFIDDMRKRKRRRVVAIILASALIGGIGAYETIVFYSKPEKPSVEVVKNMAAPVNKEITPVVNNANQANPKPVIVNKNIPINRNSIQNVVSAKINSSKVSSNSPSISINNAVSNKNSALVVKEPKNIIPPTGVTVNYSGNAKDKNKTNVTGNNVVDNNKAKEEPTKPVAVTNIIAPQVNMPVKNEEPVKEQVQSEEKEPVMEWPSLGIGQFYLPVKPNDYRVTDTLSPVVSAIQSTPPVYVRPRQKGSLSVELGAGYSLGWKYGDTSQANSIYPVIGIGYSRALSDKLLVKTGLQFSTLGNIGTTQFVIKHVNYDFEYNAKDTAVTTKTLYYLTIPLQLEYKIGQKNAVGAGGTLSYMFNSSGTVNVYSVEGNTVTPINSYSQNMYIKGYNQWNASAYVLYKRNITEKLSVYLIPYLGLMNIKSNSFFMENSSSKDSGVKILLSYTIL